MKRLAILVGSTVMAGSLICAGPAWASASTDQASQAAATADASGGIGKIGTTGASMSVVHTQDDDRGIAGAHVEKSGFQTNDTAAKS